MLIFLAVLLVLGLVIGVLALGTLGVVVEKLAALSAQQAALRACMFETFAEVQSQARISRAAMVSELSKIDGYRPESEYDSVAAEISRLVDCGAA